MASDPITSWQTDGETMETVTDFILGGSKITADGDCSHEIKRCLLLGRKAMTNLDSILKSRDITLPTKVCLVKAMVLLVVMYGCESWTIKKAERQRIDAFELWCWRRLLRVPWTARSNQSILKEISSEYSLEEAEAPILWPPDTKSWLSGKDPNAGKDWRQEDKRTTEDEMVGWHHWLDGYEFEQALGVGDGWESWRAAVHGVTKSQTQLSDWTKLSTMRVRIEILFPNLLFLISQYFSLPCICTLDCLPICLLPFPQHLSQDDPTFPCWCVVEGTGETAHLTPLKISLWFDSCPPSQKSWKHSCPSEAGS